VNVILVPALLLLIGLVVYKKVIEPRRAAGGQQSDSKAGKPAKSTKSAKVVDTKPDKKAFKARANAGSGRMGSVL